MRSGLGDLLFRKATFDQARTCYQHALQEFSRLDDLAGQARTANGLGCVAMQTTEWELAMRWFACAYTLLEHTRGYAYRLGVLINFGITLQTIGYSEQALEHIEFARRKGGELGLRGIVARAIAVIGQDHSWSGDLESAKASFAQALAVWEESGNQQGIVETRRNLAEVDLEAGRLGQALALARHALKESKDLGYAWGAIGSTTLIGKILLEQGEVKAAMTNLTVARDWAAAGQVYWRSQALVGLAACYRRSGRLSEAASVLEDALSDSRPRERGRAHAERARVALSANDLATALRHADVARRIAARHKYHGDEARMRELLPHHTYPVGGALVAD
jgi:tetratricopeptide (TPR) repeat protein